MEWDGDTILISGNFEFNYLFPFEFRATNEYLSRIEFGFGKVKLVHVSHHCRGIFRSSHNLYLAPPQCLCFYHITLDYFIFSFTKQFTILNFSKSSQLFKSFEIGLIIFNMSWHLLRKIF